jgi:putative cell wall-binding protein
LVRHRVNRKFIRRIKSHTAHSTLRKINAISSAIHKRFRKIFISENEMKLEKITQMQEDSNLKSYESGNILLIHLDFAKTSTRFNKKRRVFNKLARFISYEFGNVKCFVYNVTNI